MKEYSRNYFRKNFSRAKLKNLGYDWVLLFLVGVLTALGLVFLASTLSVQDQSQFLFNFVKQIIFGVWLGIIACYVLARTDYKVLFKYKNPILFVTIGLLGFLGIFALWIQITGMSFYEANLFIDSFSSLPVSPHIANGSIRWIDFKVIFVQPSEIAKLALLIYFSSFLVKIYPEKPTWLRLKRPIYAFLAISFLIFIQPDLGSILLTFVILFSAMYAGGVGKRILGTISIVVIAFGVFASLATPYRRERVLAVFDPTNSAADSFQIDQAQRAISNGGLWGQGYGLSSSKQQNLILESSTDSIIAVIAEEMGFVVTTIFVSLYLFLFFRAVKIAQNTSDIGGKAMAIGIGVWIISQAYLNISGNLGLVPLKGVPLPFVSAGNSSIILNFAGIGILMNISSQSYGQVKEKVKKVAKKTPKFRFTKNIK